MTSAYGYSLDDAASDRAIVFRPPAGARGLAYWLALPDRIDTNLPPLVAVHGIRRNARQQAQLFADRANALCRPVIAPLFDRLQWPRYQQAVRPDRADLALIALMDTLKADGVWRTDQFELFGFSGGAQFAHRFAMLHPRLVARLTIASAGWYTFPDAAPFPYGLSPDRKASAAWSAIISHTFDRFLTIPTQVCVGADDNFQDDNVRSGQRINAQQGEHRLIRGIRWTRAIRQAAMDRGLPVRATFIALSACGHDFGQ